MRTKLILSCVLVLCATNVSANIITINFDDITSTTFGEPVDPYLFIPDGYAGFSWSNFALIDNQNIYFSPTDPKNDQWVSSPPNAGFLDHGHSGFSSDRSFDFLSIDIGYAGGHDSREGCESRPTDDACEPVYGNVHISGYNDGALLYEYDAGPIGSIGAIYANTIFRVVLPDWYIPIDRVAINVGDLKFEVQHPPIG